MLEGKIDRVQGRRGAGQDVAIGADGEVLEPDAWVWEVVDLVDGKSVGSGEGSDDPEDSEKQVGQQHGRVYGNFILI